MLASDLTNAVNAWVRQLNAEGRVGPVQMPPTTAAAIADPSIVGELASRLAVPDPTLGAGPAQWDYQLGPDDLVAAWNDEAIHDDLVLAFSNAVNAYSDFVLTGASDVASTIGATVGEAGNLVGKGIGGFLGGLGVAGWAVVAGVAGVAYWALVSEHGQRTTRRAVSHARTLAAL